MFEYDELVMAAANELDKHDLSGTLKWCYDGGWRDPDDIRDGISQHHNGLAEAVDELSDDELMMYLSAKYNVRFEETITYSMRYMDIDSDRVFEWISNGCCEPELWEEDGRNCKTCASYAYCAEGKDIVNGRFR